MDDLIRDLIEWCPSNGADAWPIMRQAAAELRTLRAERDAALAEGVAMGIKASAKEVLEWFPDGAKSSGPAFAISSAIRALSPAVIIAADTNLVRGTIADSDGDDGA